MSKKKVASSKAARSSRSQLRAIALFSAAVFLIKVIWLSTQQGRGLLGADGENYLEALDGLLTGGFFSEQGKLSYWPAGYPILMWPLAELSSNNLAFLVGTLQSLLFAVSVAFFSVELSKSSLKKFTWPAFLLLSLSPTLTLNSLVIGYEVTSAVLFLLVITLYMRLIRTEKSSIFNWENSLAALSISISCFMQPRVILLALGIIIPFAIYHYSGKAIPLFLSFSLFIVAIAPSVLIFRNTQAQGFAAISTNLGTTMNIGAGPNSTGGYTSAAQEVPCEPIEGDAAKQDSHKVGCVLKWYLENPATSLKLFVNKFFFHWSPWFGPLSNGTMLRNPWLQVHPFAKTVEVQEGFGMVYGNLGKLFPGEWIFGSLISWVWILGSLGFLAYGFIALKRRGGLSTFLAWALLIPVLFNTASSMGTIGDHRFRIPTLSLSLLLQLFGAYALFSRKSFRRGIDGPARLARGLNWKGRGQGDNLRS
jgi:hypothetical protein